MTTRRRIVMSFKAVGESVVSYAVAFTLTQARCGVRSCD